MSNCILCTGDESFVDGAWKRFDATVWTPERARLEAARLRRVAAHLLAQAIQHEQAASQAESDRRR